MDATIEDLKGKGKDKDAMIDGWQAQSAHFAMKYNKMEQIGRAHV